jgi:hypothetical protein
MKIVIHKNESQSEGLWYIRLVTIIIFIVMCLVMIYAGFKVYATLLPPH